MNVAVWTFLGASLFAAGELPARSVTVEADGAVKVGQAFPGFAGWTLDGELYALKDALKRAEAEGRPLIVTFGAKHCRPCLESLPILAKTANESNADVVLIAHRDNDVRTRDFLAKAGVKLLALPDPHGSIGDVVRIQELPRTYVLRPTGEVQAIFVVEGKDLASAVSKAVAAARARPAVAEAVPPGGH